MNYLSEKASWRHGPGNSFTSETAGELRLGVELGLEKHPDIEEAHDSSNSSNLVSSSGIEG